MARLTRKQKEAVAKIDKTKLYSVDEASALIKEISNEKFDASVDLAVRLGVDPRKANQMVRGVVSLPHGTGKDMKVLALVTPDKEAEAKDAGADIITIHPEATDNLEESILKIKSLNKKVGVSLNPETKIDLIIDYLEKIDLVLIMNVNPGFGETPTFL